MTTMARVTVGDARTRIEPVAGAVGDAEDALGQINVGENDIAQFLDRLGVGVGHGHNPCDGGPEPR